MGPGARTEWERLQVKGYFFVSRAVPETKWWREARPLVRSLWIELMSRANFSEGRTARGQDLQPGMLVTSWRGLSQALAWKERRGRVVPTIGQVRWAMNYLRRAGEASWTAAEITATGSATGSATGVDERSATGGGLVVTLTRWALHQSGTGSATGGEERSATGVAAGSATGSYKNASSWKNGVTRKTPPIKTPPVNGSAASFGQEELLGNIDSLRKEIPLQRAELEKLVMNGGKGTRWRELQKKMIENGEVLAELEHELERRKFKAVAP